MSVFTILYRNVKWRFHNSFTIVITILQPILWLVLYSAVAGQTMKNTGIENYTAFILPGIVVLVSFSTCSNSGIVNYMMKSDGSFYRVLIAPIKRSSIVLGQLLHNTPKCEKSHTIILKQLLPTLYFPPKSSHLVCFVSIYNKRRTCLF